MRYTAVIFDLDGTLLDSLADLAGTGNRVLEALGLQAHPVASYRYFVGDGMATLVERILPDHHRTPAMLAQAIELFREDYAANWDRETDAYAGVPEMLNSLSQMGVHLTILSNKPDNFTRICVDRLLPQWRFHTVLGQREQVPKKPDPAGAREILQLLPVNQGRVLYVGDTAVDMQTAAAAGLDSVGVLWGFREADELRQHGATYLIEHPMQLVDIVTG